MNKAELKTEYKNLVRQGNLEEAEKVLNMLRDFSNLKEFPIAKKPKKKVVKKVKKKELDDLIKIKGIGKKTLAKIKDMYFSISELKKDLLKGKVPLRKSICTKLIKYLK